MLKFSGNIRFYMRNDLDCQNPIWKKLWLYHEKLFYCLFVFQSFLSWCITLNCQEPLRTLLLLYCGHKWDHQNGSFSRSRECGNAIDVSISWYSSLPLLHVEWSTRFSFWQMRISLVNSGYSGGLLGWIKKMKPESVINQ